jgi:hypothetical protein
MYLAYGEHKKAGSQYYAGYKHVALSEVMELPRLQMLPKRTKTRPLLTPPIVSFLITASLLDSSTSVYPVLAPLKHIVTAI